MVRYGVVWHPMTDNLGDDLQALAAMRLMPRVDHVLDGEHLDAPLIGLKEDDRVVTLLSGNVFRRTDRWPPEKHIVPVCVGMHFSQESVWGIPMADTDGAGLKWLKAFAPIGCRDAQTHEMLRGMGLPVELNGCLTLTLDSAKKVEKGDYICCVDVPQEVEDVLRHAAKPLKTDVRTMTHQRLGNETDFDRRMQHAQWMVDTYAGAKMLITRRLHAAMAGVAVGTPTLLLYHASYEDVTRFAPMDGMIRSMPVEDFVEAVRKEGFPGIWENPPEVKTWRSRLMSFVNEGMKKAETCAMSPVSNAEAAEWRMRMLSRMAEQSEKKIRRLEKERTASLHEKFTQLMREDHVRATIGAVLAEKDVPRAIDLVARKRLLRQLPWYTRPGAVLALLRKKETPPDLAAELKEELSRIGWPDHTELLEERYNDNV